MATLVDFLRANKMRCTPEREAILEAVLDFGGHFTPEEVARKIAKGGTKMSAATVYRNLPVLVEAKILRRTCLSAGEYRYEVTAGREHHDHLICTECGTTTEFQYEAIEILQRAVAAQHGFVIKRHHLELVGVCARCQSKKPQPAENQPLFKREELQ